MKQESELPISVKHQLAYLADKSPYYSRVFKEQFLEVNSIRTLENFKLLPFTTKEQLYAYNDDFLCVPKTHVVDIVTTSGTMGEPVAFYLSEKDLVRLGDNEYKALGTAGVVATDIVQLTTTLDKMFMAGIAYYLGLRKIGAKVIRVGPGMPEIQWQNIRRFEPTVLIAVPSFLIKMIEYANKNGIDYQKSSIQKIICIGESIRNIDFGFNALGMKILHLWPSLKLHSTYASTEMATAFTECDQGCGGHVNDDLIFVECVDEQGNHVKEGELGELVVTTLGVEAMPMLRFKTGDVSFVINAPCACGRTAARIGPILGRKQQMIKYKGTTLYPSAINEVLRSIKEIHNFITEVKADEVGLDAITIYVHCEKNDGDMEKRIKDHFRAVIRVAPQIVFQDPESIEKMKASISFRKPVDFIDRRSIG